MNSCRKKLLRLKLPVSTSQGVYLKFKYRLTVYDASEIQKVTNQVVEFNLDTTKVFDLAMRDAYADRLNEPNNMEDINPNDWNIWLSPDIWNRQANDGQLEHEDPEYFNAKPNYLYTRIHNYGCILSPSSNDVKLNLYWTISSTGETWKQDWDGTTTLNGQPGGQDIVPSGIAIPSLAPGQDTIIIQDWTPPKPQDYDTTLRELDVCVLARIQTKSTPDYRITFAEDSITKTNVRNNNNIITRNLVVNNYNTLNATGSTNGLIVGNSSASSQTFTLEMATDHMIRPYLHGDLSRYMTVSINLGQALYAKWVAGGRQGNPNSYNNSTYTVTYDLKQPLHLENITMPGNARYWVHITYSLKPNVSVPVDVTDQCIHFRQLLPTIKVIDIGDGTTITRPDYFVYGNVTYKQFIKASAGGVGAGMPTSVIGLLQQDQVFALYPNPANTAITLSTFCWTRSYPY